MANTNAKAVQDTYNQATTAASDAASDMQDKVLTFVQEKPYVALLGAMALGYLVAMFRR